MVDKLVTDIGGEPAGAVPQEDRDQLFWEKQMIAAFNLLQVKGVVVTDEFRRTLIEKGVLDADTFDKRAQEILAAGTRDHV